jgi:hypothetical protein
MGSTAAALECFTPAREERGDEGVFACRFYRERPEGERHG